jgi:hypothetical protein
VSAARRDRFEAIYRAHHGAVRAYLLRRAEPELAQDALSETFLVAWRRVPSEGIKDDTVTYLVDARSYLPLEVRNHVTFVHDGAEPDEVGSGRIEYLRYEPLPVTGGNMALLDMDPHPGARRTRG